MTVVYFFILVWQLELPREQIFAGNKNQSQANTGLIIEDLTKADQLYARAQLSTCTVTMWGWGVGTTQGLV